jgi:5-methylthioadenosine/S-adenosylhomocysteine deaminase
MKPCDLLIKNGLLIDALHPLRPNRALVVDKGRIIDIGTTNKICGMYRAKRTLDATDKVVLPGFINAHTHASATLFRGYAADVSGKGFFDRMWPIEALLRGQDVYVGALAGCVEMIKNGVTGFANHFSHMDYVARAVQETGMRAGLSRTMLDRGDAKKAEAHFNEAVDFADRWQEKGSRIQPMLGPHAAYTCSDKLLKKAAEHARRTGLILHIHVAESPHELALLKKRTGATTVQHLERLGFFDNNRVLGAHALILTARDLKILGRNDFHAAICATGKMHRGQGIADLQRLIDAGINVCLGTDGSASDNLDILLGMKVAYIGQNYLKKKVYAVAPETILSMGTYNAANALRWPAGALKKGLLADIVLMDLARPHLRPFITKPRSNALFNIVYYATGADIDTVIIDGNVVMQKRKMLTVDETEVLRRLQNHAQRLWSRASRLKDGP